MLTWFRESYVCTAADEAATELLRLWTPDGVQHRVDLVGPSCRREDWNVHYMRVWITTTAGTDKFGINGELAVGMDYPAGWHPVLELPGGHYNPNLGQAYQGPPFIATHGVGWHLFKSAVVDTDRVYMQVLYEPIKEVRK